jgi:TRAP-type C4-dicarboxylate transport system permease small subunit
MSQEHHTPLNVEQMAQSFEEDMASEADLSVYAVEDWFTFIVFWAMAVCVFLQFFTRYVLNNSLAWTEELAANGLVMVVFLGSVMCVRMMRHIQVDIIFRFLPVRASRILNVIVDLIVIAFFAYMCWLMWRYVGLVGRERMVTVNLPRGFVFYAVLAAFVLMLARAVQNFVKDIISDRAAKARAEGTSGGGL